jgi:hypothetical protein
VNSNHQSQNVNPCQSAQVFRLPTAAAEKVKQPRGRRSLSVTCLSSYRNKRNEASIEAVGDIQINHRIIARYQEKLKQSVFEMAAEQRNSYVRMIRDCQEYVDASLKKVH